MCRQKGWAARPRYHAALPDRQVSQVARIVAVNGTHRPPDALAPLINTDRQTDVCLSDKGAARGRRRQTDTKCHQKNTTRAHTQIKNTHARTHARIGPAPWTEI